ncbi:MAG: hypothetical protein H0T42_00300 [Deltaproteobacteria bacterium]|nr:hypothetical protein [Deltaproteobacteria bacterium]
MTHRLSVVYVVALIACKTASDDWVPSDVDESETIDKLGAAGYAKVCSAFDDFVRDQYRTNLLVRAACTAQALQSTETTAECADYIDECVNDIPTVVETQLEMILDQASCPAVGVMTSGCSSPVSALTTCLDDLGAQVDNVKLQLTCAALGSTVPADWWRISPPASCTALASGC